MFSKYIENFLNSDECESIIQLGNSIGLETMKSSRIINGKVESENTEYAGNKRMGCYFSNELLDTSLLSSISNKIIELSNNMNPFKGIIYNAIPKYSFNRYSMGDFLDWHPDMHEVLGGATITFIIQLNDEYDGGIVKYSINDIEYDVPKKQGSVFIFDSNISHCVDVVGAGVRYSLNVWPSSKKQISLL
jgi:predicted 2-oxoglutarate/Fe(II)-dependent dioxygenase YbiX